jgi:hypothetical protein
MRKKLRATAAVLGAGLFALGLSFGAALAEGDPHVPAAQQGKHYTPAGVCLLVPPPKD